MVAGGITALDPPAKRRFARLIAFDLRIGGEISPASIAAARLAQSLARAFETGRPDRKSGVQGKRLSVSVDLGGRRSVNNKKTNSMQLKYSHRWTRLICPYMHCI